MQKGRDCKKFLEQELILEVIKVLFFFAFLIIYLSKLAETDS